jgi:tRNA (Thr-GGU) A37 N-methylase
VEIVAQRAGHRLNRLGTTRCRIVRVAETQLFVADLDAIDGTPVLDLKPVMSEFQAREPVRQPAWSHEAVLMQCPARHSISREM